MPHALRFDDLLHGMLLAAFGEKHHFFLYFLTRGIRPPVSRFP
jgi:hypothetical protein